MNRNSLATAVGASLIAISSAFAQNTPTGSEASGAMIADIIDIAPWGLAGADGKPAGIYPNIFKRLSERSGCELHNRLTPIPRAVLEVSRGTANATMVMDREDLNESAISLGEVTALRIEVWLPQGSPLRSLEDLAGKTIGVLRGPQYHEKFQADSRIVKHPVTNARQQLEMISKGRLDGAIGVRENFLVATTKMGISPNSFAPPITLGKRVVKLWLTPSMSESPCTKRLAQALKDLRTSGEIDRLIADEAIADRL